MTLPPYLVEFFRSLNAEENISLKKTFEGDFSDVGKFTILAEKYLENNETLLGEIIPEFITTLETEEIKASILEAQKEKITTRLDCLYKDLENTPGSFYEIQIQNDENRILELSMSLLKEEAHSIFDEVVSSVLQANKKSSNQTKANYVCTYYLAILYKKFKSDVIKAEKYSPAQKTESKLFRYYKSLDVDLKETDRQFAKYDLLSISSSEQIISGLPNRIFDNKNNSQFLIDIPEAILDIFAFLLKSEAIKNISFLVECEVVFQTSMQYFILLGNEKPKCPVFLVDFLNDVRDGQAIREVVKKADTPNIFPPHVLAGRFYDTNNDSAWYFIDSRNIYFEEISSDPEVFDDCVVTQLIHIEYFIRSDQMLLAHIDHEYIFYSYDEFDKRLKDFSQKGSARKRIKTFKIDNSEIPIIAEGDVLVLNTILEYLFKKPYLFNGFVREITKKLTIR
ncbi:hypothetical protein KTQ42_22950 [Noviherbaspirillum sp. L7-7A]|uniref:hypothetical protein n=1 Tax=Noviherbaspirillum sp. L7-7A TaxID=2850560 RepID=UPI001C2C0134|nr:hypothetical protein [Noviherbaspirillum sp. L7-7A]MBV0882139.1 hypothetical protein [Noviherbaspirillum sp. L7-7A]